MEKQTGIPRNPRIRYRFQYPIFDFFFQWLAGTQTNGGAESGEAMFAASRIPDGDPESWYREFTAMGRRVEARADASMKQGHCVSARESYLRCYVYYRAAPAFFDPRSDERYRAGYEKARDFFRKAGRWMDPPLETLAVPFEGKTLPGYFARVAAEGQPRKTLFMIGGADTFVEDLYFYIVPAALRRGYNVLFFDLPGQGSLPWDGLFWRADMETPLTAVTDFALANLPQIDAQRMAIYGISAGGYIAPRAAMFEKRFKACLACSVILDFSKIWSSRAASLESGALIKLLRLLQPGRSATILNMLATYKWRWGAETIREAMEKCRDHIVDPARITCAMLNLVSEQEYNQFGVAHAWAEECLQKIQNPRKSLIVTPCDEGADSHAVGTNLSLMSQLVFDWLDETLGS